MTKVIKIEGMMCPHCEKHVYDGLYSIQGISSVDVSHEKGEAEIKTNIDIPDDLIIETIEDAGYKVTSINTTEDTLFHPF